MNEGDPSYLRAKAKRYRRLADEAGDADTQDRLNDLAGELERDADRGSRLDETGGDPAAR